jgi:fucose permease
MLTDELGSWRLPFQAVGAVGVLWAIAWLVVVPSDALPAPSVSEVKTSAGIWQTLLDRRMLIILAVVALINTTWQVFRAWLPKFLQEGRGYEESQALYFNAVWFAITDLGCLGAGAVALWLVRRGQPVVTARLRTFLACALMTLATVFVPWLPKGWLLLAMLLVAGAGALGVFPTYHAFTQDLTRLHQGKVTGVAGVAAWAVSPLAQRLFGRHVDETHSFDQGLALAGCLPIIACALLYLAWPRSTTTKEV